MIVLLQVLMQYGRRGFPGGDVVHGHFDVAPSRIIHVLLVLADRAYRSNDQLATVDDGTWIHKPRPRPVVIKLNEFASDVISAVGIAGRRPRTHGQNQQTGGRQKDQSHRDSVKFTSRGNRVPLTSFDLEVVQILFWQEGGFQRSV